MINAGLLLGLLIGNPLGSIVNNFYYYGGDDDYYYEDSYYEDSYISPSYSENTLYIDNPTQEDITVKVGDNEEITVYGYGAKEIEILPGKFDLYVNGELKTNFTKSENDGKSFLNPTKSDYIIEAAVYSYNEDVKYPFENTVSVDSEEFTGPFAKVNDYYMKGKWQYGIGEDLPYEIDEEGEDDIILTKIYRNYEFIDMYYIYYSDSYEDYNYDDVYTDEYYCKDNLCD